MTTTPPGWYDDGHDATRWWDGTRWTEHVAEPGATDGQATATARSAPTAIAPAPPPAPAKSRLWIVWVVLGVVVLAIVILAATLVPRLIAGLDAAGPLGSGTATDPDQRAAVATVELYDEAWQDADCESYAASTTESFRTQSGLADCSAFETEAETFTDSVEDYEIDVTDVRRDGDAIVVTTTETYTALVDEDGAPLDEPSEDSIDWVYTVVADGDDWLIDGME
ncbi:hypothetical protein B1729_17160 [Microbacterium sp. B35-04]|uniref:DUF2510 domain-containing protein n=1 Tax=unclassified Microbacterium TaxID=2609290 RepID=UPI0013D62C5F|nr:MULTISPECIES: DUF2510 domain-containing protein [unclassified Microbacterium]KAF2412037.1 hypothetical protein B1729_17160 [Microbacterium sp. B35-04]KAF2417458.1 hypothetical protein B2K11_12010 [Microbacterium sp. B35-30]